MYYRRCVGASDQQRKAPGGGGDDATDEAHAPGAGEGAAGEARGEGESKSEPNGARVGGGYLKFLGGLKKFFSGLNRQRFKLVVGGLNEKT